MEDMVEKDKVLVEVDVEIVMEYNHLVVENNYLIVDDNLIVGHNLDNYMVLVTDMVLFHIHVDHLYFLHFIDF